MITFFTFYIAIGLLWGMYTIYFMKNTTPNMLAIAVECFLHEVKESGVEQEIKYSTAEMIVMIGISVYFAFMWPFVLSQRML